MKAWIDVGGTFTDCFVVDELGRRRRGKVLSSGATKGTVGGASDRHSIYDAGRQGDPPEFWIGFDLRVFDSAGELCDASVVTGFDVASGRLTIDPPLAADPNPGAAYELVSALEAPVLAVRRLLGLPAARPLPPLDVRLGTTRGTNALLTRRGARVALATTEGLGDVLRIGTQERPDLFALDIVKPPPLTEAVVEIDERLAADGSVLRILDERTARIRLAELKAGGAESLAICLLHAYRNDVHERRLEALAREVGFAEISLSSQIAPLIKLVSRAETTTLDAYLNPILATYVSRVWDQFGGPSNARLRMMTSGGQLVGGESFRGRDSILSGPAGGVVALASIGDALRPQIPGVIGFDMGGTSTDVSRYEGTLVRQYEGRKAGVRVMTPMMAIHTVAAGGGSICHCDGPRLLVGPDSAGSDPGPACYGRGGPLSVTDLNLILGRVVQQRFPFRLDRAAAERRLRSLLEHLQAEGIAFAGPVELAEGFWRIAVNHMAEAVRTVTTSEGVDPRPMALVGFGGAAAQHVCAVADALGMQRVVDHPDAGMFSALGMGLAPLGRFASQGFYETLATLDSASIDQSVQNLRQDAMDQLAGDVSPAAKVAFDITAELRYHGSDAALQITLGPLDTLPARFHELHRHTFGYMRTERSIELVTIRVEALSPGGERLTLAPPEQQRGAELRWRQRVYIAGRFTEVDGYDRDALVPGATVDGPALIAGAASTLVVEPGWRAVVWSDGTIVVDRDGGARDGVAARHVGVAAVAGEDPIDSAQIVDLEIVARRLQGIAEQMGEVLRRTSVSVNVKERLDYSCAVFRGDGCLVAGAMHVPVHLGAMGHTVRNIMQAFPEMFVGDCYVSNDPYAGGSHLPDVTVVSPVFAASDQGVPDFYVASRAHHAEIGGMTPGSMPPAATNLAEEGVVIRNFPLLRDGHSNRQALEDLLRSGPYPSRTPAENWADIQAQVAAGLRGVEDVADLARQHGTALLDRWMSRLLDLAADSIDEVLERVGDQPRHFSDTLDDGSRICLEVSRGENRLKVDFTGTSGVHPHGWNATPSIVSAAVLYVLRCLAARPLPLSEGVLRRIDLHIPVGLLNPPADDDPARCPAVVAGNVETSQRVVDCLLGAFQVAAASQGTMNNLLLGDDTFGYYETICGGAGATPQAAGADAVHTHMTNTRITDPEVLEMRYPLRLVRFAIRRTSGGGGRMRGGDGVIREIEVLRPLTLSLLTGRRGQNAPYGLHGGQPGLPGVNLWIKRGGEQVVLPATTTMLLSMGDRIRLETPGGGGCG